MIQMFKYIFLNVEEGETITLHDLAPMEISEQLKSGLVLIEVNQNEEYIKTEKRLRELQKEYDKAYHLGADIYELHERKMDIAYLSAELYGWDDCEYEEED